MAAKLSGLARAIREAHDSCPAMECDERGGDHDICTKHHAAIRSIVREAAKVAAVSAWIRNPADAILAAIEEAERGD